MPILEMHLCLGVLLLQAANGRERNPNLKNSPAAVGGVPDEFESPVRLAYNAEGFFIPTRCRKCVSRHSRNGTIVS